MACLGFMCGLMVHVKEGLELKERGHAKMADNLSILHYRYLSAAISVSVRLTLNYVKCIILI